MKNPFKKQKVPVPYLNTAQQKTVAVLYGEFVVKRKMPNSEFVDMLLSYLLPYNELSEEQLNNVIYNLIDKKHAHDRK